MSHISTVVNLSGADGELQQANHLALSLGLLPPKVSSTITMACSLPGDFSQCNRFSTARIALLRAHRQDDTARRCRSVLWVHTDEFYGLICLRQT